MMTQDAVNALYSAHRDAGDDPMNAYCRLLSLPDGIETGVTKTQALAAVEQAGEVID